MVHTVDTLLSAVISNSSVNHGFQAIRVKTTLSISQVSKVLILIHTGIFFMNL